MLFSNVRRNNFKFFNCLHLSKFLGEKRIVLKKNIVFNRQLKKLKISPKSGSYFSLYKKKLVILKNVFLKKNVTKWSFMIKYFYICMKKTKSNFFCYILNYKNCFISLSLGQTGKKGPIKMSIDAYEILGYKFVMRLFKFYLFLLKRRIYMGLILVLTFRSFKPLRKFLKKFFELGLKFIFVFVIFKFAHNGCRTKNKKRK